MELRRALGWYYANLLFNHKRLDAPVTDAEVASSHDKVSRVLTQSTRKLILY